MQNLNVWCIVERTFGAFVLDEHNGFLFDVCNGTTQSKAIRVAAHLNAQKDLAEYGNAYFAVPLPATL